MYDLHQADIKCIEILTKLWIDTFKQAYKDVHTIENLDAYCSANFHHKTATQILSDKDTICKITYKNNKPVGFYIVKHHQCPVEIEGTSSELKQVYILASEYGTGLGKMLFEGAAYEIQKVESKLIWLCVANNNYRAQNFYKKYDFQPIGIGPIFNVGTDQLESTIMVHSSTL
jgi:diamine N-acetyltransferase